MAGDQIPVLLPCHGTSKRGIRADDVADDLARRGLAEIVEDIEQIVAAAREGRQVIALDGCAASCQARVLDARGVQALRALNLSDEKPVGSDISSAATIDELEAAASPLKRTRRPLLVPTGELSEHSTHSLDDYLFALDQLTSPIVECGAVADAPTVASHVARILGVSRPSAGEMLARLEDGGYIRRGEHKDVLLTTEGRHEADRVLRKLRILECFAADTLGYGIAECYERAREIAPGFDDEALERVWAALGEPEYCPHGWPIDPERSRLESRGLVALSAAARSTAVRVERLDETSRDRLHALADSRLAPGCVLDDIVINEAAEVVGFVADGARRSISLTLAAATLVRSV